ncbi:hypothetical protein ABK040_015781 [Willaertia magna]
MPPRKKTDSKRKRTTKDEQGKEFVPMYKKIASKAGRSTNRKPLSETTKQEIEEKKKQQQLEEASNKTRVGRKKKTTKPHSEEVEALWQGWKDVFLVGTEWNCYDFVYKIEWDFDHLHDFLFEEKEDEKKEDDKEEKKKTIEERMPEGKKCFVFGCTEPQLINGEMVYIPALIAVVSDLAPPEKIGISSVQMVKEDIVDMDELKMSWTPFIPKNETAKNISFGNLPNVFALHCNLRRSQLKRMKEEDVRRYEYCLPYCFRPNRVIDEIKKENEGSIEMLYVIDGKRSAQFSFDPESDDLDTIVEEVCEDYDLDQKKHEKDLKDFIKDEVKKQKEKVKEKINQKQKEIDKMSQEQVKALNEMKVYKFYPQNSNPDLSSFKVSYVNRYYGKADKMF